jgi:predicted O-methyltransferase YrrM
MSLRRAVKGYAKAGFDKLFGGFARKSDVDNLYGQLSSLLEIREIVGPGVPIGPLRKWALSPDALLVILREVTTRSNPRVVEFGAGGSTIALAATLRAMGSGSLTTIEHNEDFAKGIAKRLDQSKLLDYATIRTVPLIDYGPRLGFPAFRSYDLKDQELDFDVALVDGPIVPVFGPATRSVPLEWCVARLAGQRVVYLDDASRAAEQTVLDASKLIWQDVETELIRTEKGLARISHRSDV